MASFAWDDKIEGKIVKLGWDKYAEENKPRMLAAVRRRTPVLKREVINSLTAYYKPGGKHGTRLLVIEATSDHAKALHDGRGPVEAKPGGVLTWLTALTGGRLNIVPDGNSVVFSNVKAAKARPFIVRGLEDFGLVVKGWKPNPKAGGSKF